MNLGMGEDPPLRKGGKGGNVEGVDRYRRQPCAGLRGRLPPPHKNTLKSEKKAATKPQSADWYAPCLRLV